MLNDEQLDDLCEFMFTRPELYDNTLTYTKAWLESRDDLDAKAVLEWIKAKGAKCDSDVYQNIAFRCTPEARKNLISQAVLEMSEEFKDLQDEDCRDGLLMLRKWLPEAREDVRTKLEESIADLEARMRTEVN